MFFRSEALVCGWDLKYMFVLWQLFMLGLILGHKLQSRGLGVARLAQEAAQKKRPILLGRVR